jgi:soluble lytic murein transglycosylase
MARLFNIARELRLSVVLAVAAFILFRPAVLVGQGDQTRAAKERRIAKVRAALKLQETSMSASQMRDLARSVSIASERHALDPLLVLAIIEVESQFNNKAHSSQGARGLMQVQPAAVTELVKAGKISRRGDFNLFVSICLIDPALNVAVGVSYLALMKENFGDLKLALTAYNLGPTSVSKKIAAGERIDFPYATKVLSVQRSLENRLALNETEPLAADQADFSLPFYSPVS